VLVGDNEQEVFLGNQIMSRREISEQTHQLVDAEVKRVLAINPAYGDVYRVAADLAALHLDEQRPSERYEPTTPDRIRARRKET